MHDFATFVHDRTLVSVRRDAIDQNKIQGFVLAASESLFLLQYVYDFNLDGLMVLRTTDVTDLKSSKTEEFQRTRLEEEGLISKVPFGTKVDLSSWHAVIAELSRQFPLMILECEDQEVILSTFR